MMDNTIICASGIVEYDPSFDVVALQEQVITIDKEGVNEDRKSVSITKKTNKENREDNITMNINEIAEGKNLYLIDFSYILYRSHYSLKTMGVSNSMGLTRPTGHIYGTLKCAYDLISYDPNSVIVMCLDGYPEHRKTLCESAGIAYKADRTKPDFPIKKDTQMICELLSVIPNVYIAENEDAESDDVMFAMSRQCTTANKIYIYTSDNDLLQSINDGVNIIRGWEDESPIIVDRERYMTEEKYTKKFLSVPPEKLPFYRALVGDSSDNIKGIHRMPKALAKQIAEHMTSISDYATASTTFKKIPTTANQKKILQTIQEDYKRIQVNYEVMRLLEDIDYELFKENADIKLYISNFQLRGFESWLNANEIKF